MSLEKLQILGGPPAFEPPLPLYRNAGANASPALAAIGRALETGTLTKGPAVREFEVDLEARTGGAHVVAVGSGSAAITLALLALRLEGEIVLPAYVFPPVVSAVLAAGLTPRFADVDSESWNLDPATAEASVGPRTSAILAVHTSGFPAFAPALESIAARRRLRLLFDAAHALGAKVGERPIGTLGSAETFSFTPSKLVVAGEGGAVATADARLAGEIACGRNYGRSRSGDWSGRGMSARMPDVSAIIGRASLRGLDEEIARRSELAAAYRDSLAGVPGIRWQSALRGTTPVYRDISLRVIASEFGLSREALRAVLEKEGVGTGSYFHPPVNDLPLARRYLPQLPADTRAPFPIARMIAGEVVNLPVAAGVTPRMAGEIGELIRRVHENAERIAVRFQTASAPRASLDPSY